MRCRSSYIRSILERFNVSRTSPIPAFPSVILRAVKEKNIEGVPFREVVGSLMWIADQTRPDIANAVQAVARYSYEPREVHWEVARKILAYLRATAHLGITYHAKSDVVVNVEVYVDADYASEDTARRSISDAAVMCCNSPVA